MWFLSGVVTQSREKRIQSVPLFHNFQASKQHNVLEDFFFLLQLNLPTIYTLSGGVGEGDEGYERGSRTYVYSLGTRLPINKVLRYFLITFAVCNISIFSCHYHLTLECFFLQRGCKLEASPGTIAFCHGF